MKQFLIVLFFSLTFLFFPKTTFAVCSSTTCGECPNELSCMQEFCAWSAYNPSAPIQTCRPCSYYTTQSSCPIKYCDWTNFGTPAQPTCQPRTPSSCSINNCSACSTNQCTSYGFDPFCIIINQNSSTLTPSCDKNSSYTCSSTNCGYCGINTCNNTSGCMLNTANNTCVQYTPPDPLAWLKQIFQWIGDQWSAFWSWLFGCFFKAYTIPTDPTVQQQKFNDYGVASNDQEDTTNVNAAENRTTSYYQHLYFKGRYMLDVINNTNDMPDMPIAKICNNDFYPLTDTSNNCSTFKNFSIVCLAKYFILDTKKPTFVYTDQFGTTQPLTGTVTSAVDQHLATTTAVDYIECPIIPQPNFSHYQNVYLNFFRVPPNYSIAVKNENATRVLRTPVPNAFQTPIPQNATEEQMNTDIRQQESQLNQNFIPEGQDWDGLGALRPQSWNR